ncbi:MAG: PIN domain-containing protein [Smithellaceae bacterium]|nr:PIN domain-containing protein [Smithellaceae bacterium]
MLDRLLDSVIIIDHFNDVLPAKEFLLSLDPQKTAISVISFAEILTGLDEDGERKARPLLSSFEMLEIDAAVAEKAAALRRQHGWKMPDAFQAAIALRHGIKLCTRNTKDFNPQKHSFVEIPYLFK